MRRAINAGWPLAMTPAVLLCGTASVSAASERPNLVLIVTDDQGWGDVGYNGHPDLKTPVLDEMAATGLRFDRFYAAHPVCSPTRGSLMTGRHPNRFGCLNWGYSLRPEEVTLAEALKTAGYATGLFGKWHLGPVSKDPDSPVGPAASGFDEYLAKENYFDLDPELSRNGAPLERFAGDGSDIVAEAACAFIARKAETGAPFFAFVAFGSPHKPFEALPEDRKPYEHLGAKKAAYFGELAAVDRAVGAIRRRLRESKVAENTIVWFMSDNGPMPPGSSGGLKGRKRYLFEGGIRVPGLLEWPAVVKRPTVSSVPCVTSDVYPTILDIVGIEIPNQPLPLDGVSLRPLIEGKPYTRPDPIGFWIYPGRNRERENGSYIQPLPGFKNSKHPAARPIEELQGLHAAWLDADGRYKFLLRKGGRQRFLFDLNADPRQRNNLADKHPDIVERMTQELNAWKRSVENSLTGADYENLRISDPSKVNEGG